MKTKLSSLEFNDQVASAISILFTTCVDFLINYIIKKIIKFRDLIVERELWYFSYIQLNVIALYYVIVIFTHYI